MCSFDHQLRSSLRRLGQSWFVLVVFVISAVPALASSLSVSETIIEEELISEAVPTAFEVARFREADFEILWKPSVPAGVNVEIISGSLTWVRVSRYLVLPRARVKIILPVGVVAEVRTGRSVQALQSEVSEVPISLFSTEHELTLVTNGQTRAFQFSAIYRPQEPLIESRVFRDVSCSSHRVKVVGGESLPPSQWAYLGCRMVRSRKNGVTVPQLELLIAWSGTAGQPSVIPRREKSSDGRRAASLTSVLLSANQPRVRLYEPGGGSFEVEASLPNQLSTGSFGLGLGPYFYSLEVSGVKEASQTAALTTLYGSYSLSETSRLVFFDAFPVHRRWYNDFGLYFNTESSRALDERLTVNLLLGFHWIAFWSPEGAQYRLGVPQGFEMILRDALGRRRNASVGGFFYPPIDGKSYYNAWVRVGTSRLFAELNYLAWTEKLGATGRASSESYGICIGAPLVFF